VQGAAQGRPTIIRQRYASIPSKWAVSLLILSAVIDVDGLLERLCLPLKCSFRAPAHFIKGRCFNV
jgi:hypothetical protein